jgi:hypothetical protein
MRTRPAPTAPAAPSPARARADRAALRRRPSAPRAAAALAAALALSAALPNVTPAQSAPGDTGTTAAPVPPWERRSALGVAVGGAGLFQSARGSAGQRVQDGGGFDVFGSVAAASFALGVGYQRSEHRLPGAGRGAHEQGRSSSRAERAPFRTSPRTSPAARLRAAQRPAARARGRDRGRWSATAAGRHARVVAPGVQLDLPRCTPTLGRGARRAGARAVRRRHRRAAMLAPGGVGFDRWGVRRRRAAAAPAGAARTPAGAARRHHLAPPHRRLRRAGVAHHEPVDHRRPSARTASSARRASAVSVG